MSLRLFTAVELNDGAREQLAGAIAALRQAFRAAGFDDALRWVATANLHLTLRFLGNVDDAAAQRMIDAMRAPIVRPPAPIVLGRLGTFPPRGRPRVLHIGVQQGADTMGELRDEIDARLAPLCTWEPDTRPFAPHLTLARARDTAKFNPVDLSRLIDDTAWPAVPFHAAAVTLFSSRTLPAGPEYTVEQRAALRSD